MATLRTYLSVPEMLVPVEELVDGDAELERNRDERVKLPHAIQRAQAHQLCRDGVFSGQLRRDGVSSGRLCGDLVFSGQGHWEA